MIVCHFISNEQYETVKYARRPPVRKYHPQDKEESAMRNHLSLISIALKVLSQLKSVPKIKPIQNMYLTYRGNDERNYKTFKKKNNRPKKLLIIAKSGTDGN